MKVVVEADGGSRGNPGPAGYGAVVWSASRDSILAEAKSAIGRATNNVAEYRGLIAGLEAAAQLGASEADVFMDSKLVVEQMAGRWRVKHPDLAPLHQRARDIAQKFDRVRFTWVPRGQNGHADALANQAMDAASGTEEEDPPAADASVATTSGTSEVVTNPAGWTGARGAPTRLLLLRHGQTELSVQRRYSGRGNPALTELGTQQADAAARYLGAARRSRRGGVFAVAASP